ncbi:MULTISPECIES: hypothetical protein [unclassified Sutcliffiella]
MSDEDLSDVKRLELRSSEFWWFHTVSMTTDFSFFRVLVVPYGLYDD